MTLKRSLLILFAIYSSYCQIHAKLYDFEAEGAIPIRGKSGQDEKSFNSNRDLFNNILSKLQPGDTFYFNEKSYMLNGGICGENFSGVRFVFDGVLKFQSNRTLWPAMRNGGWGSACENDDLYGWADFS